MPPLMHDRVRDPHVVEVWAGTLGVPAATIAGMVDHYRGDPSARRSWSTVAR